MVVYVCETLKSVKNESDNRVAIEFDVVQLSLGEGCARRLMIALVDDIFEIDEEGA